MYGIKRVVVTGLGALTPLGNNIQEYWNSLINGVSGAAPITYFDTTHFKTKFVCELKISMLKIFGSKRSSKNG